MLTIFTPHDGRLIFVASLIALLLLGLSTRAVTAQGLLKSGLTGGHSFLREKNAPVEKTTTATSNDKKPETT